MAIGIDRSAGDNYAGLTGVLNGIQYTEVGQSVVFYIVAAGVNLSAEDDAANEAFEAILQVFPSIITYYAHASTGIIGIICDGVNAPSAAALEAALDAVSKFITVSF